MNARIYSDQELTIMVTGMRAASDAFYLSATRIGNHAFIEFCGLMNEYIKVCENALRDGEDFTTFNIHCRNQKIPGYMLDYFQEKMSCILGVDLDVKIRNSKNS